MDEIPWDRTGSLLRVIAFATTEPQEEPLARGTLRELVSTVLAMPPEQQQDLMIRVVDDEDEHEFDEAAIRELAAHPSFTGVAGAFDTADLPEADDPRPQSAPVDHKGLTGVHPREFADDGRPPL